MKKISLNFMNRLELAIFKNVPASYAPVSSTIGLSTLVAAATSIIIIFFLQMFNADTSTGEITLAVVFAVALLVSGLKVNKAVKVLTTTASKVYLAIYSLVLFGLCSLLFIWLMVWVMIIAIALLVFWFIIKGTSGTSGNKKRIRVHYRDGSSEEMTESGKGICGETYYDGERGGRHVES